MGNSQSHFSSQMTPKLMRCRTATGNAHFAEDFTKWIFQETGVIKVVDSTHFRKGETEPRELYRIKDDLVCFILAFPTLTRG
jgi:hypothetical protein